MLVISMLEISKRTKTKTNNKSGTDTTNKAVHRSPPQGVSQKSGQIWRTSVTLYVRLLNHAAIQCS
jgi:hypothetical protein